MKHSELKQIIKEELQKILSENTPKYKKGDTLTYMGTKHEVVSDDGFVVKAKLPNGKIKTLNYSQLKKTLNESPYPLIPKKMLLADILELNDIPDSEFGDKKKYQVVDYIRRYNPNERYLENIVAILKQYKVDTSELEVGPEPKRGWDMRVSKDINPNEDNPMRGRIGGTYRGD